MENNKIGAVLLAIFLMMGLTSCGSDTIDTTAIGAAGVSDNSNEATPVSISITPDNPQIASETQQQFTATGIYADNTTRDLTAEVTWSSSDPEVASNVDAAGSFTDTTTQGQTAAALNPSSITDAPTITAWRVQGNRIGRTTIRARYKNVSSTTSLTVSNAKLASLAVTPVNPIIARGTGLQFTATGTFSDNTTQDLTSTVTWISSNPAVATISISTGSKGMAAAVAAGSTTVTASWKNASGSTVLKVTSAILESISITPATPSIANGTKQQFTATGTYTDGSTQNMTASATWSSSDTTIATISNTTGSKGLAASVAAGSTIITAVSDNVSGSTTLTVTPATLESVAVEPAAASIANGTHQQFTATGTFSDNTTQDLTASATWSSSNTGIATISNAADSKGKVSSVAAGTTTIAAISGSISGSATLTVTSAALMSLAITPANQSIADGTLQQFHATGTYTDGSTQDLTASVTWSSSNAGVATISNATGSKGMAVSVAAGSITVTATSASMSASTTLTVTPASLESITITPASTSISTGAQQQFAATGTYSDGSTQNLTASATWSSSNTGVATISNATGSKGLTSTVAAGTSTITAVFGSVSGATTLSVTTPIITGSATLTWSAPTLNTDGTPLTDLAGYKIHYGTSSGNYTEVVDVGKVTIYTLNNLLSGTYFFTVTAYDTLGNESGYSNEGSKTIQ